MWAKSIDAPTIGPSKDIGNRIIASTKPSEYSDREIEIWTRSSVLEPCGDNEPAMARRDPTVPFSQAIGVIARPRPVAKADCDLQIGLFYDNRPDLLRDFRKIDPFRTLTRATSTKIRLALEKSGSGEPWLEIGVRVGSRGSERPQDRVLIAIPVEYGGANRQSVLKSAQRSSNIVLLFGVAADEKADDAAKALIAGRFQTEAGTTPILARSIFANGQLAFVKGGKTPEQWT